jgi:hypothetical protein
MRPNPRIWGQTLETDDAERVCLLLGAGPSSRLSLDRARDDEPELPTSAPGSSTSGSRLSPGLADRDIRGQGISPQAPLRSGMTSTVCCCL